MSSTTVGMYPYNDISVLTLSPQPWAPMREVIISMLKPLTGVQTLISYFKNWHCNDNTIVMVPQKSKLSTFIKTFQIIIKCVIHLVITILVTCIHVLTSRIFAVTFSCHNLHNVQSLSFLITKGWYKECSPLLIETYFD